MSTPSPSESAALIWARIQVKYHFEQAQRRRYALYAMALQIRELRRQQAVKRWPTLPRIQEETVHFRDAADFIDSGSSRGRKRKVPPPTNAPSPTVQRPRLSVAVV
jgi:hypothetical protein